MTITFFQPTGLNISNPLGPFMRGQGGIPGAAGVAGPAASPVATLAQALAGTDNTLTMTPLRVSQAALVKALIFG